MKTNDYTPYNSNNHSRNTSNDYDTNLNDNNTCHTSHNNHVNNGYNHHYQQQHHHHHHQDHINNRNLQFSEAYKDNNNKSTLLKNPASSSSYKKPSKLNENSKNRRQSLSELSHPGWGLPPIRLLNNNVKQKSRAHVLGKGYFAIGGNGGILLSMLNNAIDDEDDDDNYEDNYQQEHHSLNGSIGGGGGGNSSINGSGNGSVNGNGTSMSGIEQVNAAMASDRNKFDISSTRGTKSIPSSFHDNSSQPTFFDHHSIQGSGSLYGSTNGSYNNRDVVIDHRKNIAQMKPSELESLLHQ
ncbi:unnamed protein product [[Candida] boidinii]|nr:unnamed protein product [[Candida] boidinii]